MELKGNAPDAFSSDSERGFEHNAQLRNTTVNHLIWKDVTVTVQDRATKQPKAILENVDGVVLAGMIIFPVIPRWICILTWASFRRDVCFDGPKWLWENNSLELPRQARQLWG